MIKSLYDDCNLFNLEKNGLLFTYGVTNAGKSYTIMGNEEEKGLLHFGI